MTQTEALKAALEALEGSIAWDAMRNYLLPYRVRDPMHEAITAIKTALAQSEQEPIEYWNAVEGWVKIDEVRNHFDSVSCGTIYKNSGDGRVPLYTTPPQRKPLSDEELEAMAEKHVTNCYFDTLKFARAIEAAHNIKEQ